MKSLIAFTLVVAAFSSNFLIESACAQAQETPKTPSQTSQFLSWEHTLTTRSSKANHAVAKLKIYNNWTPTRHRLLVQYNVLGLGSANDFMGRSYGSAFAMPDFSPERFNSKKPAYHHGSLGIVTRLDDDKLIGYSSEANAYIEEARMPLLKRLRFDPWKKIAPELSKNEPLQLTPPQRERLGREMRASARPLLKKVLKTYFRPVAKARVFDVAGEKIEARGYRMTWLLNVGGFGTDAQWARVAFEWWIAPDTQGDAVMRQYFAKSISQFKDLNGPTTSMWTNEMLPVLWQAMPQELHQALATFAVQSTGDAMSTLSPSGAPVYFAMTTKLPQDQSINPRLQKIKEVGSVRLELQLTNRNTSALPTRVFEAPPEYKKDSLEPMLKHYEDSIHDLQSIYDEDTRLADAGGVLSAAPRPRYSWRAWNDVTRKLYGVGS